MADTPQAAILGPPARPDITVRRWTTGAGTFLAFDGPSWSGHAAGRRLPARPAVLAEAGFGGQLLLGGDTTVPGTPGVPFLSRRLHPCLEQALGKRALDAVPVDNPARAFARRAPSDAAGGRDPYGLREDPPGGPTRTRPG
ncbi:MULTISPECIES: hypothetical protein [unclassified Streptomyces]|uniref:hypothetical protein n=1 Tax=unclassified Streptomyces TaxID=2593676 RepID=UPI000F5BB00F|nr:MULTISPECIES: hypothetical protein [unclassified Streptomyces]MCX4398438.1 hypothetical protein [Streptomyces sp. NBC_01767]MCX5098858.1 hypothetical protein [Streptomyces sp. NBC_00439]WSG49138.1 hypothetical protein OHA38_04670 [Streptomyces sp. NBC_01732]WSW99790.1 hypothetical protein OG355_04800 [Streptomyces sp. NBC_00987]